MTIRDWFTGLLAIAVLGLALTLWIVTGQVGSLRGQVHQARATYLVQERNDRQALNGLGRSLRGIVRRDVAAACKAAR